MAATFSSTSCAVITNILPHGTFVDKAKPRNDIDGTVYHFSPAEKAVSYPIVSRTSAPQRLVALGADGADILQRLGVWPQVVGVTAFYRLPPGVDEKPRVSGFSSGNIEAILKLEPDLVITSTDVQHQLASDLIKAGVTVWAINSRSLEEIYDAIRNLGQIVRQSERAEELVARDGARFAARAASTARTRPRVYFEEWPEPLITGIGWVSELIERAGGTDIFAELRQEKKAAARTVTPEEVVAREPEIIFASWCGKPVRDGRDHLAAGLGQDSRRARRAAD